MPSSVCERLYGMLLVCPQELMLGYADGLLIQTRFDKLLVMNVNAWKCVLLSTACQ